MQHRWWAAPIPVARLLTAVVHAGNVRHPSEAVVRQCVRIYADDVPKRTRIGHFRQDGWGIVVHVHHLDWTGKVRCALYRDGSLDDVGTLNRKSEVLRSEPPVPSNP